MSGPVTKVKDGVLGITDVVTPEPLEGVVEILDDNIFEPITGIVDDMLSVFW